MNRQQALIPLLPRLTQLAVALVGLACLLQFSGWLPGRAWLPWCLGIGLTSWLVPWLLDRAGSLHGSGALRLLRVLLGLRLPGLWLMVLAGVAASIHSALDERLPAALEGQPLWLAGTVENLPQRQDFHDRIVLRVEGCEPACGRLRRVSLSWGAARGGSVDEEDGGMQGRSAPPDPVGIRNSQATGLQGASKTGGGEHGAADDAASDVWPQPGQRWRLQVKLKRPVAAVNPGAFDSELRLLQQGIGASGRVVQRERLPSSDDDAGLMDQVSALREWLRLHIERLLVRITPSHVPDARQWSLLGIVTGLSLGEQSAIGSAQWALFSRTGVSHLMAISGMHVTLLAMLVSALCLWAHRWLARRADGRLLVWLSAWPRPWVVLVPGVFTAFGYALLSGWGAPAQRTCFMLLAAAVLRLGGRFHDATTPVLLAAAIIIALDPWAVAQAGFWLSFCAVLALIWCSRQPLPERVGLSGRVRDLYRSLLEALRSQWAVTVLLTPLTIAFFSTWSLIGPVANALAIPWVGMVLTPMSIAVMVLAPVWPWLAAWLLKLLIWQLDGLMQALQWLDALPLASLQIPRPGMAVLLCAMFGAMLMLAPLGLRRPRLGMLCLLPLLLAPARTPPDDELVITALDIGQGSMILVEQGDSRLLYDTGTLREGGRSTVEGVLQPYLNGRGLTDIDWLVVSHLDAHHAGGAAAAFQLLRPAKLLAAMQPALLGIDLPGAMKGEASDDGRIAAQGNARAGMGSGVEAGTLWLPCLAGQRHVWGSGVIEVLNPRKTAENRHDARDDRNGCMLRIRTPAGAVVLAGDLPARSERSLLRASGGADAWRADVLVLPQQGSRHGAGDALLSAVQPAWAIVQTTHANHHGHPHPDLLARLELHGTKLLRTDQEGAVRLVLRAGKPAEVQRTRVDSPPYWRVGVGQKEAPAGEAQAR